MLAVALLLLAPIAELANGHFRVERHDYRYVRAAIAHWPAMVVCKVEVAGGPPVRIELVTERELMNFVRGRPHQFVVELSPRKRGEFHQAVPDKGDYDILLVDENDAPSDVSLQSGVQFAAEPDVARYLSPERRRTVIAASLLFFVLTVSWSGVKLMHAMRRG